jgi:capsular polysaccharide biosynthesis protein
MSATAVEREISLLALLDILQSRWKLVLMVGVVAALLNTLLFALSPYTYESTATILVSRTRSKAEPSNIERTLVDTDSFAAALMSGELMEKVLKHYKLDQPPYEMDIESMGRAIGVWAIRNQNSVQVQVRLSNLVENTPQLVADIANFMGQEADRIAREVMDEDIRRSMELFDRDFHRSEKDLEAIRDKLLEVRRRAPTEQKRKLIDSLGNAQAMMYSNLSTAQSDYLNKSAKLLNLNRALQIEKPTIELIRALEEEPSLLNRYSARTGTATTELYDVTSTLNDINLVYVELRKLRDAVASDVEGASAAVQRLPEYIQDYSRQIHEAELILGASEIEVKFWEVRLETAQLGFQEVNERREVAVMSIASDRQDLLSWIRATPPLKPAGLPRPLFVGAAAVLTMGLLAVFILLMEVMKATFAAGGTQGKPRA